MYYKIIKSLKLFIKKILGIKTHPSFYTHGVHKRMNITTHESFKEFSELAKKIIEEKKSYLYFDRFLTIYDSVKSRPLNSELVEIGVKGGGSAKFIASLVDSKCKIYCCDTFIGHTQIDKNDGEKMVVGDHGTVTLSDVKKYLEPFTNIKIIKGDIFQTYNDVPLENIGFVHLDVDLYLPTKFVLNKFFPKVKKGCIFILDDYLNINTPGVKKSVDEFRSSNEFKNRFYFTTLLTGQAIIVKIY